MPDTFTDQANQTNPAALHFAIVPSDTGEFTVRPRAIYCQAAGTCQIVDRQGNVLPYAMTAGQFIPFRGLRVNATGTTGTYYGWY